MLARSIAVVAFALGGSSAALANDKTADATALKAEAKRIETAAPAKPKPTLSTPSEAKPGHTGLLAPSSAAAMDQALTNKIHQTLVGMTDLQGAAISSETLSNIKVTAHRGIVTLSGLVNSEAEKSLIGDRVQRMDSVLVVKNELQVAGRSPAIGAPADGEAGKESDPTKTKAETPSSSSGESSAAGGVKSEAARPSDQ